MHIYIYIYEALVSHWPSKHGRTNPSRTAQSAVAVDEGSPPGTRLIDVLCQAYQQQGQQGDAAKAHGFNVEIRLWPQEMPSKTAARVMMCSEPGIWQYS